MKKKYDRKREDICLISTVARRDKVSGAQELRELIWFVSKSKKRDKTQRFFFFNA